MPSGDRRWRGDYGLLSAEDHMGLNLLPGLPAVRRQELRALILAKEHELADKRAREAGLTLRCQRASAGHDDHRLCRGEMPGNTGCLCSCHDTVAGEAEAREDSSA
jgi:hypothetical protein